MRSKRLKAGLLALLLLMACCFTGCLSAENEAVLAPGALPENLDPQLCEGEWAAFAVRHLFEGLTVQTADGVAPGAAESWEISPDRKTYTFTLRADASWWDGEPVEAEDFVFAFERLFDPSTGSAAAEDYRAVSGGAERLAGEEAPLGVEADGDTVVFTLAEPDGEFLALLSLPAASPCREDFFRSTYGRYGLSIDHIMGNGQFALSTWDGELIRMRGRGDAEGTVVRMQPGAEENVYWEEAEAGELEWTYGLLFNQSRPLFRSEEVRAALAADLPEGLKRPAAALSPGLREGLRKVTLPGNETDAARYRRGASGKETEGLSVLLPENEEIRALFSDMAQVWQRDFGLYLAVEVLPERDLLARVEAGEYDCAVLALPSDVQSPGRALQTAGALSRTEDGAFWSLLAEGRRADGSKANKLYTEAEQRLLDSGGFIPLGSVRYGLSDGGFPARLTVNREISFYSG